MEVEDAQAAEESVETGKGRREQRLVDFSRSGDGVDGMIPSMIRRSGIYLLDSTIRLCPFLRFGRTGKGVFKRSSSTTAEIVTATEDVCPVRVAWWIEGL